MTANASPTGLFEAHLTVSDLSRALAFYRDVVDLELAFESPERGAAFLWVGPPGHSMLGLWEVEHAPQHLSLHLALRTSLADVLGACDHLRSVGVTPLSFFATETDEPSVIGWMPAAAVFFRDPDGHLLEYLAMLDAEPRPDFGILPWSQWPKDAPADGYPIHWYEGPRSRLRELFELADDSTEQIDSYINLGRVLVANADRERIVGHLQLVPATRRKVVEIRSLAVHPHFRRRGIGTRLVDHALAVSRTEQRRSVTVTTAIADIDNLRFYQRRGFRASSILQDAFTRETGYSSGLSDNGIPLRDAIRFDLSLTGAGEAAHDD